MTNKMKKISTEEALQILREGHPLENSILSSVLDLRHLAKGDYVKVPITMVNCDLEGLNATFCYFQEPVILRNVKVGISKYSFFASYFFAGLTIEECTFKGFVDFSCGGHNKPGNTYLIRDTDFLGSVDFSDNWFEGPVEIRRCHFKRGTNLLGNKSHAMEVTFDVLPIIQDNIGELHLDGWASDIK